jgi:hypothetical protein
MDIKSEFTKWAWYEAYCSAMLETDVAKVVAGIESARKVIQDRVMELDFANTPERGELSRAIYFLGLLRRCAEADQEKASVLLTRDLSTPALHASAAR